MAHKLLIDEEIKKQKRYTLPDIEGRFGISFYVGSKEIFFGTQITTVLIERVTKKKLVKINKGKVNVFKFD
jgi:heme/copper-type cytochrome/quinol oxidase subunit 3